MNSLLIDITYRCNLRCKHCYNKESLLESYESDIDYNVFCKLIKNNDINHIHLLGGEPLLYNTLDKVVKEHKNIIFSVNTNGLLLNKSINDGLFENKNIKEVTISVDGFDQESNDCTRGHNTFSKVLYNYKKLVEYKKLYRKDLIISIATVLLPSNVFAFKESFFKTFGEANNFLFSTCYNTGSYMIDEDIDREYYIQYFEVIKKLYDTSYNKKIIIDTTPLIMLLFNIEGELCSCNKENNVMYSDNKGKLYSCIPEKQRTLETISNFCSDCIFYEKCKKCVHNLYLSRANYCETILEYCISKINIMLSEYVILKEYMDWIYIFNKNNKKVIKYTKKDFYTHYIVNDNKVSLRNEYKSIIEIKKLLYYFDEVM